MSANWSDVAVGNTNPVLPIIETFVGPYIGGGVLAKAECWLDEQSGKLDTEKPMRIAVTIRVYEDDQPT